MDYGPALNKWLPAAGAASASAVLFFSGFFAFVFAIPIQIILVRRGNRYGAVTALLLIGLIFVGRVIQVSGLGPLSPDLVKFLILDSLLPAGIVLALLGYSFGRRYLLWSLRLPAVAAVALVFALPAVHEIVTPGRLEELFSGDFGAMFFGLDSQGSSAWLADQVALVLRNTIGVAMLSTIAANWWIGTSFAGLRANRMPVMGLHRAFVDDRVIWALIAGFGLIVFEWIFGIGNIWSAIGWNLALCAAFLFGVQGLGIIQHELLRRGVSPSVLRWTLTAVAVAVVVPGINVLVIGGLPLLGASEIWVNFRRRGTDESNPES